MAKSPVSILFTTDGVEVGLKDGLALPTDARGFVSVGVDGSGNSRFILTDTSGRQIVVGPAAAGSAVAGAPVLVGGSDGTNARYFSVDASGRLNINVVGTGGASFGSAFPGTGTAAGFYDGTNMQAARVFDADTGAGTQLVLGAILRKSASGGSVEAGTSSDPLRVDPTGTTAQPVTDNGGSLTVDGTVTVTQTTAANLNATAAQGAGSGVAGTFWTVRVSDGSSFVTVATDRTTAAAPFAVRLSDGSAFYTAPAATQLPSSLVGGRLDTNIGTWLGSTAPTVGQKTSANSIPIVFASDQSTLPTKSEVQLDYDTGAGTQSLSIVGLALPASGGAVAGGTATNPLRTDPTGTTTQPVSGTVTSNIGTTGGLALDATLTGGTQKAIVRGGAKGATTAADVTSTAEGTDHQALDVQIYHGGTAKDPTAIRALTSSDVVTAVQGTAAAAGAPWAVRVSDGSSFVTVATDRTTAAAPFSVRLSDGAAFYTAPSSTQLPSSLVGGRLDTNNGAWLGSTAPTVGQKAMASSIPVVIASDQSAVSVSQSGTWTVQQGTPPWQVVGPGASGAAITGNPVIMGGSDGTNARYLSVDTSGRPVVVQPTASLLNATVTQGPAAALSGYWPVRVTDGTNTMPTGDAVARAVFQKVTDGTNTAAVKAASTVAATTDPALVVALSPNIGSPLGQLPVRSLFNEDTFGQFVISQRVPQIQVQFNTEAPSTRLVITTTGSGSTAMVNSLGEFSTGTSTTAQSKGVTGSFVTYSPHHEVYAAFTAMFTAPTSAASYQRIGLYDTDNGFAFGYNGTTFGVWLRAGGVDTFVAQASWNTDTAQGGSTSKFTRANVPEALDQTKINLFRIRFGWFGIAPVLFEVLNPDGHFIVVHTARFPNIQTVSSINNPNLPITVDVSKTSSDATNLKVSSGCWVAGTSSGPTPTYSSVGSISANGASVVIPLSGMVGLSVTITGTWVGTLGLQHSIDGLNWINEEVFDDTSNVFASSITTNRSFSIATSSYRFFRVVATAWTSGTALILYGTGPSAGTVPTLIAGRDGTLSRVISTDSTGQLKVVASAPSAQLALTLSYDDSVSVAGAQAGYYYSALVYTVPVGYNFICTQFNSSSTDNRVTARVSKFIVAGSFDVTANTFTTGASYTAPVFSSYLEAEVTTVIGGTNDFTLTATYTNQDGVSGRTATATIKKNTPVGFKNTFVLQTGDYGVRSVQAMTRSTANTGALSIKAGVEFYFQTMTTASLNYIIVPAIQAMRAVAGESIEIAWSSNAAATSERIIKVAGGLEAA